MITINVIKVNEVENWKIGKEGYSVEFSKDLRDVLLTLLKSTATTVVEANEVPDVSLAVDTVKSVSNNVLLEILKDT
jgi:predicted naringenin-chalcone synthase